MCEPLAKVIGVTAGAFVELKKDQHNVAIEIIGSVARNNIVLKFTNDGFKLTNHELSGGDNDESGAVSPLAKKVKKTTAGRT